jgi:hypothetical protein
MIGLGGSLNQINSGELTTEEGSVIIANSPTLWLKRNTDITVTAGTNDVTAWADQSTNDNPARQSVSGRFPQYINGGVQFNLAGDADQRLDLAGDIDLNEFTIIAVLNIATVATMGLLGSGTTENIRIHQGDDVDRVVLRIAEGSPAEDADMANLTQDIPTNKFVFTFQRGTGSTDNVLCRINGTDVTDTTDTRNDSDASVVFTVSDIGSASGNFLNFQGVIFELAIFSTPLTSAKMDQIEDDMKLRCGLL